MSRWKIKARRSGGRKKQERRKEQETPGRYMITVGLPGSGISSSAVPISPADSPHLARYLKAHKLLPFWFRYNPDDRQYQQYLEKALIRLADPDATTPELTEAIVILGHSPVPRAIKALTALSGSRHKLSGMARMAAQECLMLMGDDGSGMLPVAGVN